MRGKREEEEKGGGFMAGFEEEVVRMRMTKKVVSREVDLNGKRRI